MQLGIIGLGRMGGNIAWRLMKSGHTCVVNDHDPAPGEALAKDGAQPVASLAELVQALEKPAAVWVMLPAGKITEDTVIELGKLLGIDPATPLAMIEWVLHLCDVVLVMTVNPGFGGQAFLPEMLGKIAALRELCAARGVDPLIAVDGGQDCAHAAQAYAAGATVIVAGSAIFGAPDYRDAIRAIRDGCQAPNS